MTARELDREKDVLIVDRLALPREKVCGGLISPRAQRVLEGLAPPDGVYASPKEVQVRAIDLENDREADLRSLFNGWRDRLDEWLLHLVPDNVEVMAQTTFVGLQQEEETVEVILKRGGGKVQVRADYVVGAEGASLSVRRILEPRLPKRWVGLQEWIQVDEPLERVYMAYDMKVTRGFLWAIPKDHFLLIGGLFAPESNPREDFERMKELLQGRLNCQTGAIVKREGGRIIKVERPWDVFLGRGRVLLVGESAGLISGSSGEGLSFALLSGEMCARAINRDGGDEVLGDYKGLVRRQVWRSWSKIPQWIAVSNSFTRWIALKGIFGGKRT